MKNTICLMIGTSMMKKISYMSCRTLTEAQFPPFTKNMIVYKEQSLKYIF